MGTLTHPRPILDVSKTPTVVFGHRSLIWMGTIGLMTIEGTMFGVALATYFFLRTRVTEWPPGVLPPAIFWGTLNTVVFLVSAVPNQWVKNVAEKGELGKVRIGLVVLTLIGLLNIGIRVFEFPSLNCSWDTNAYGSIAWTMLGLHTVHLVTDWVDSVVLTALMFTGPIEGRRFMDVSENSDYWYFVVMSWLPIYFVLYFAPRLL
jgi:heme/copper-type cytochrome/quinol oxidase subunit 3